jgi:hypothetical protein
MKHLLTLACLMMSPALFAESFAVPFRFHTAGTLMPAGRYELSQVPNTTNVFRIESGQKSRLVSFPRTMTGSGGQATWVVFDCTQEPCRVAGVAPATGFGEARRDGRLVLVSLER